MPRQNAITASRFGIFMDGYEVATGDTFHFSNDAGGSTDESYDASAALGKSTAGMSPHMFDGAPPQQIDETICADPNGAPSPPIFGGEPGSCLDDWL